MELAPGDAAKGALEIWPALRHQTDGGKISFFISREMPPMGKLRASFQPDNEKSGKHPTHLLSGHIAYRISDSPLILGLNESSERTVMNAGRTPGHISMPFFSIQLRAGEVVLSNLYPDGTYVDDTLVTGSTVLGLGQTLRTGMPERRFHLIICRDSDET